MSKVKPAVKPKVTKEEQKYRKENFPDVDQAVKKNVLCTTCNASVKPLILKGKVLLHPFMDTLLCQKCYDFYGDGDFSVDEDGSDKYCRWCGQGGTLYLCSSCSAGFCRKCIKRNLSKSQLKEVEDDDWKCYCCVTEPLYELRGASWAAQEYAKKMADKKGSKNDNSSDSDLSDHEVKKGKKTSDKKGSKMDLSDSDQSDHESKKDRGKKRKYDSEEEVSASTRPRSERSKKRAREDNNSEDDESSRKRRSERTPKTRHPEKSSKNKENDTDEESAPKRRSERTPKKPAAEDESEAKTSKKKAKDDKKSKVSKPPLSRQEKKLYKRIAVKFTTVLNDANKICDKVKSNVSKCKATSHDFTNIRSTEDIKNARESIFSMLNSIKQLCVDMTDIVSTTSDKIIAEVEKLHEAKEKNGVSEEKKQEDDHSDEDKKNPAEKDSDLNETLENEANDVTRKIDDSFDDDKSLIESDEGDNKKTAKKSNIEDMDKSIDSTEGKNENHNKESKDKSFESSEGQNENHNKSLDDEDDENDALNRSNLDVSTDE